MSSPGTQAQGAGPTRPALSSWLVAQVWVAALWLLSWAFARVQEYAPDASLWFPPAGLTFAVGIVLGWRGLPGVVAAALVATLLGKFGDPARPLDSLIAPGLAFGLAHGGAYILGARLLLWLGQERPSPRFVSALLLVAPLTALTATLGGLLALTAFGGIASLEAARAIVLPFWIGDMVGTVALGPFFVAALAVVLERSGLHPPELLRAHGQVRPAHSGRGRLWLKLAACLLPLAGSAGLVAAWPEQAHAGSFLVFFGIVPLMWIAHTEGALRTYVSTAALSTAIACVGAALGPGAHGVTYQFAMIVLAGSAYFGLTVPLLYADNRHLRQMLITDSLTRAATRAYFLETAEREVERARRFKTAVSLALFDLDHFKQVNDDLGHAFGDAALARVAELCRAELRASDLLARLGGEEFAVLLPMTGLAAARETAERVAAVLRRSPVLRPGVERTVTASFGVVEIDAQHEAFQAAFERADAALYQAKAGGRDRVCPA